MENLRFMYFCLLLSIWNFDKQQNFKYRHIVAHLLIQRQIKINIVNKFRNQLKTFKIGQN